MPSIKLTAEDFSSINEVVKTKSIALDVWGMNVNKKVVNTMLANYSNTSAFSLTSMKTLEVDTDESFQLNIFTKDADSILKLAKGEEMITFDVGEDSTLVYMDGVKKKIPTPTDVHYLEKWIKVPLEQSFTLNAPQVEKLIKAMSDLQDGDVMVVTSTPERTIFVLKAYDAARGTEVTYEAADIKNVCVNKDSRSLFPADVFLSSLKSKPKGSDMTISMDTDVPMMFSFDVSLGCVKLVIAPRIESD